MVPLFVAHWLYLHAKCLKNCGHGIFVDRPTMSKSGHDVLQTEVNQFKYSDKPHSLFYILFITSPFNHLSLM